jgi:uncharacterized OsmC-like protein
MNGDSGVCGRCRNPLTSRRRRAVAPVIADRRERAGRVKGGQDRGPTPYDLLAAALGSCTSMTIGYAARRRQWALESVLVQVRHSKVHAEDCVSCETKGGLIDRLERTIALSGPLTDDQREELLRVADRCPMHRTLRSEIDIRTALARSDVVQA